MTRHSQTEWTQAEHALIDNFQNRTKTSSEDANTFNIRKQAMELFKANGLPSRKVENWHYTDLRLRLNNVPDFATSNDENMHHSPLVANSHLLQTHNGTSAAALLGDGIQTKKLSSVLAHDSSILSSCLTFDDTIGQLNTLYANDGWDITVNAGTDLPQPIEIQNIQDGGQGHALLNVHVGENARCTFIERLISDDKPNLKTSISRLKIEKNSVITWIILREKGNKAVDLNQFKAILSEGSRLKLYIVNAGPEMVRQEVKVDIIGENADFQLRGINLLADSSHTDITMDVRHLHENSRSSEVIRNVVTDKAKGVFQGMIRVAQKAQQTDAKMACNTLILSDNAEFDAKPELEIFADDVACGHGATVTEIDHNHLFYLMARGIPEIRARTLLVQAFVDELIDEIETETLKNALTNVVETWLQQHL